MKLNVYKLSTVFTAVWVFFQTVPNFTESILAIQMCFRVLKGVEMPHLFGDIWLNKQSASEKTGTDCHWTVQ